MSDLEHTPGPWVVGDPSQGVMQKQPETGKLPRTVAITDWAKDREGRKHPRAEEMRANARLIAAAPELLAAAKNLLADIHSNDPAEPNPQAPSGDAVEGLREAIAKAEGADQ